MNAENVELKIEGLTKADVIEIEAIAPVTRLKPSEAKKPGTYNDPTGISILVALSGPVLTYLGILAARKIERNSLDLTIERTTKDETLKVKVSQKHFSTETPKHEIIKTIVEALKIDPTVIETGTEEK